MILRAELKAVATRQPRLPFPKGASTDHWSLEVFKRGEVQKLKSRSRRQDDDVRSRLPRALAL